MSKVGGLKSEVATRALGKELPKRARERKKKGGPGSHARPAQHGGEKASVIAANMGKCRPHLNPISQRPTVNSVGPTVRSFRGHLFRGRPARSGYGDRCALGGAAS